MPPAPGSRVVVHGIVSKVHLNGQHGVVEFFNESTGRFAVSIGGTRLALKPENLLVWTSDMWVPRHPAALWEAGMPLGEAPEPLNNRAWTFAALGTGNALFVFSGEKIVAPADHQRQTADYAQNNVGSNRLYMLDVGLNARELSWRCVHMGGSDAPAARYGAQLVWAGGALWLWGGGLRTSPPIDFADLNLSLSSDEFIRAYQEANAAVDPSVWRFDVETHVWREVAVAAAKKGKR